MLNVKKVGKKIEDFERIEFGIDLENVGMDTHAFRILYTQYQLDIKFYKILGDSSCMSNTGVPVDPLVDRIVDNLDFAIGRRSGHKLTAKKMKIIHDKFEEVLKEKGVI